MFLIRSDTVDDETALSQWHSNLNLLLVTLGVKSCNYYTTSAGDSYVGALLCTIVDDRCVLEEEARLLELGLLKCMGTHYNSSYSARSYSARG